MTSLSDFATEIEETAAPLFSYRLNSHVLLSAGEELKDAITLTLHGSGGNQQQGRHLKESGYLQGPVLVFDFPDHDIPDWNTYDFVKSAFGTIHELLPVLFLLKQCLDRGLNKISLYGFSAGGGVLINVLAVLASDRYPSELTRIGITQSDRVRILSALRRGLMILDCPLRSVEEIIDFRGRSNDMVILARKYQENNMVPIQRLDGLTGLDLNILLYFKTGDEVFANRDDQLYIDRLKTFNSGGKNTIVTGPSGKHHDPSIPLWKAYQTLMNL